MLTDRILIWEELPRERFIDDHHSGAVFAVAFLKLAALPQRNGHRAKVIGRDVLKVRLSQVVLSPLLNVKRQSRAEFCRQGGDIGGRFDAWYLPEPFKNPAKEPLVSRRALIARIAHG